MKRNFLRIAFFVAGMITMSFFFPNAARCEGSGGEKDWNAYQEKTRQLRKEYLVNLVQTGILTQEQVDARIQLMEAIFAFRTKHGFVESGDISDEKFTEEQKAEMRELFAQRLELRKEALSAFVRAGRITQAQADSQMERMLYRFNYILAKGFSNKKGGHGMGMSYFCLPTNADEETGRGAKAKITPVTSLTTITSDEFLNARRFQGAVGIYAKNLRTGQVLVLNPDDIFAAASTIKVPVSVVVYRHFYEQADSETQQMYDTGVELMLTVSDNDYFADFLDEIEETIGPEIMQEHFALLGLKNTTIRDPQAREAFGYSNVTTAMDMGLFFEQLYLGKLINSEKTNFMKDALAETVFDEELPRYMQDRRVLHKIGELDDVLADVGIVEGENGPILISIFTETPLEIDYASDYIAMMSACIYQRLSGEKTAWEAVKNTFS